MGINQSIRKWRERRQKRRRRKRRSVRDYMAARKDRRQAKRALKKARRQNRPRKEREALAYELRQARKEVDEAHDRIRHHQAKARRAAKRVRRLVRRREARKASGELISRGEWGAAGPRGSYSRNSAIHTDVIHHTAYPALPASASVAQEAAKMRAIQRGHFARGFSDIGYHEVCFPSGRRYEGRPGWAMGAHVLGHNTGTRGVSCDGNYEDSSPTEAMLTAAAKGCALGKSGSLKGHHQLNATACPGRHLKPKLGEIARRR